MASPFLFLLYFVQHEILHILCSDVYFKLASCIPLEEYNLSILFWLLGIERCYQCALVSFGGDMCILSAVHILKGKTTGS